jgi:hypothetical protein
LFTHQVKIAGIKIAPRWDIEAEHHFDVARLSRTALLDRARKEGRSTAYLWYHWQHEPVRRPRLKAMYFALQLVAWRARRPTEYRRAAMRDFVEGCGETEMLLESKLACYQQYVQEMQRPRCYEKHGLRKRSA